MGVARLPTTVFVFGVVATLPVHRNNAATMAQYVLRRETTNKKKIPQSPSLAVFKNRGSSLCELLGLSYFFLSKNKSKSKGRQNGRPLISSDAGRWRASWVTAFRRKARTRARSPQQPRRTSFSVRLRSASALAYSCLRRSLCRASSAALALFS